MTRDDCIFCKLANGQIPTNVIYEDDDFTVILDASPASKGHSLIIPKQHYDDLFGIDESAASKVMPLAKKLAAHMKEVLGCDGINVLQNNGEEAGQTVFHFHTHVIPRYKGAAGILNWSHVSFTDEEMQDIKESLKM